MKAQESEGGWDFGDNDMWIWGMIEVQDENGRTVEVVDPASPKHAQKGDPLNRITSLAGIPKAKPEAKPAPAITAIPGVPKASKNLIALVNQVPADKQKAAIADIQRVVKLGASEAQIIASLKNDYL